LLLVIVHLRENDLTMEHRVYKLGAALEQRTDLLVVRINRLHTMSMMTMLQWIGCEFRAIDQANIESVSSK